MNQLNLFTQAHEKGSAEWSSFSTVQGDRPGMFRVQSPRKAEEPRYTNIVPIRRFRAPHELFLKGAR